MMPTRVRTSTSRTSRCSLTGLGGGAHGTAGARARRPGPQGHRGVPGAGRPQGPPSRPALGLRRADVRHRVPAGQVLRLARPRCHRAGHGVRPPQPLAEVRQARRARDHPREDPAGGHVHADRQGVGRAQGSRRQVLGDAPQHQPGVRPHRRGPPARARPAPDGRCLGRGDRPLRRQPQVQERVPSVRDRGAQAHPAVVPQHRTGGCGAVQVHAGGVDRLS